MNAYCECLLWLLIRCSIKGYIIWKYNMEVLCHISHMYTLTNIYSLYKELIDYFKIFVNWYDKFIWIEFLCSEQNRIGLTVKQKLVYFVNMIHSISEMITSSLSWPIVPFLVLTNVLFSNFSSFHLVAYCMIISYDIN